MVRLIGMVYVCGFGFRHFRFESKGPDLIAAHTPLHLCFDYNKNEIFILAPKDKGGLGLGSLRAQNISLLGKWWRRLRNNTNSIWLNQYTEKMMDSHALQWKKEKRLLGTIANIHKILASENIAFQNLFQSSISSDGTVNWS
uniref:Uncharacterized protein n=1 Tax=Lactuca sativa TaxID=4236 RepID=A0A9R1UIF1_LACSA|nr:hypothetical protein LSAT_V11C900471150 [Lactuca sativa]